MLTQKKISEYLEKPQVNVVRELKKLYSRIQLCKKCEISRLKVNSYKPQLKLGEKPILIISQNPSIHRSNLPYVWGGLDKLLNNLPPRRNTELEFILNKVYVTNVVKCSTPKNRSPKKSEIKNCLPWLLKEIKIVSPRKIIVLGSIAREGLKKIIKNPVFLEHPISAIRRGLALDYSYRLEEIIIN